jgi:hypothetical protein
LRHLRQKVQQTHVGIEFPRYEQQAAYIDEVTGQRKFIPGTLRVIGEGDPPDQATERFLNPE